MTTAGLGTDPAGGAYFGAGSWYGDNPILSQTIAGLTVGNQYVISFYQAALEDNPSLTRGSIGR